MKTVKDYIPHREPFLFVDSVLEMSESHILTQLKLREDFDFFKGHYPGHPIMPGVLMCEAVFQSAGIFMSASKGADEKANDADTPILTKITNARFRRMAEPGETLTIEVTPKESQGAFHMMRGKITNKDGSAIMSVDFTITLQ